MLVLSRKEGERIVIGENITLVVSKVSGNRVTIGIEAPRDVKVARGELVLDLPELPIESGSPSPQERVVRSRGAACGQTVKPRGSLREFAASVLPLQRQVG
ncbi:MAG: carbon storage regulator [Pirellula sp.]|jgi:carbon storage regulator|nr:carbon storage regulator [Pirellula sp.]